MADKLAGSARVFAGCLVYVARYSAGQADAVTKPAANSPLWKQIGITFSVQHKPKTQEEIADVPTEDGWREEKNVYTLADYHEIKFQEVNDLYDELEQGLAAPITPGTAQTQNVKSDRSIQCWIKIQERQHVGTDRSVMDQWGIIRAMEPVAKEKKEQQPALEFDARRSSLNAFDRPA